MSRKLLTIMLVTVAAVMALAVIASCSSGKPANLEEYFKAHESEWNSTVVNAIGTSSEIFDVDISVTENTINQIMTYKTTYPADAIATIQAAFAKQENILMSSLSTKIQEIEKMTGFDISWFFEYRNGDGTPIYSATATD